MRSRRHSADPATNTRRKQDEKARTPKKTLTHPPSQGVPTFPGTVHFHVSRSIVPSAPVTGFAANPCGMNNRAWKRNDSGHNAKITQCCSALLSVQYYMECTPPELVNHKTVLARLHRFCRRCGKSLRKNSVGRRAPSHIRRSEICLLAPNG
jgi:hypothetical protein